MEFFESLLAWANQNEGILQAIAMVTAGLTAGGAWAIRRFQTRNREGSAPEEGRPSGSASRRSRMPPGPPRLLVLPFTDSSATTADDFFVDGLTEDIVAGLSRSRWLVVIDVGTTLNLKDADVEPLRIAADLGARYVLQGRLRRTNETVRATVFLLDVEGGSVLWTDRFEGIPDDIFEIEAEIRRRVLGAVEPEFLSHESAAVRARTTDLEQWELVMKARHLFWQTTESSTEAARELLEQALLLDPDDGRAWTLLAMTHLNDAWLGWSKSVPASLAEANRASQAAVRLDDRDPWAHHTRAAVTGTMGDLAQAEADLRRALELNPHFAPALGDMARVLAFSGKTERVEEYAQRAMAASPRDPHLGLWYYWIALARFVDEDYEGALSWLEKVSAARPDWEIGPMLKAVCLSMTGREDQAKKALRTSTTPIETRHAAVLRVTHPFDRDEPFERYKEGLRRAGVEVLEAPIDHASDTLSDGGPESPT